MADERKFGGPKVRQFGDKPAGNQPGDSGHCAQCEAMLADALDGTLSAADQEFFDLHMAHCGPCAQLLADAQRGAAWLEMLKTPRPEPPAMLVEKILAQTSGAHAVSHAGQVNLPVPVPVPGMWMSASGLTATWFRSGCVRRRRFAPAHSGRSCCSRDLR